MMLKNLLDSTLLQNTESLVHREREILIEVLHHLQEINRRRLFSGLGYPSLHDFAVQKLGYPSDQAYRRITAMRLMSELPEVEDKISSGALSLTHLGLAHSLFKQEKNSHQEFSKAQKLEVFEQISNQSVRNAEKITLSLSSNPVLAKPDLVRAVTADRIELKFGASGELQAKIQTLKGMLAHQHPDITLGDLFEKLCDLGLAEWSPDKTSAPRKRRVRRQDLGQIKGQMKVKAKVKREVNSNDKNTYGNTNGNGNRNGNTNRNTNTDDNGTANRNTNGNTNTNDTDTATDVDNPRVKAKNTSSKNNEANANTVNNTKTHPNIRTDTPSSPLAKDAGSAVEAQSCDAHCPAKPATAQPESKAQVRRQVFARAHNKCENCESGYALEIDHVIPRALGGYSDLTNLRLLCKSCNQRAAIHAFGQQTMDLYL